MKIVLARTESKCATVASYPIGGILSNPFKVTATLTQSDTGTMFQRMFSDQKSIVARRMKFHLQKVVCRAMTSSKGFKTLSFVSPSKTVCHMDVICLYSRFVQQWYLEHPKALKRDAVRFAPKPKVSKKAVKRTAAKHLANAAIK